ncbi:Alpha/Beta hydrolase protein [Mycena vitilis]|nr:Alpha/Beta hydrolase protein [Mycena vitilis]
MDKSTIRPPSRSGRKRRGFYLPLAFMMATQIALWHWSTSLPSFWNWKLHPTELVRENSTIKWRACPDNASFLCTFLKVPLDYSNHGILPPSAPEDYATIAMRLYPATVPTSQRLGTIFTNPGGPGTSGHALLLKNGPSISAILDGKFDVVSWDPRGVNMSTPRISCHPTELQRQLFLLNHDSGELDFYGLAASAANQTLLTASARAELLTELCRDAVSDTVLRSVATVNVARDLDEMRKVIGEENLLYWGFSYGTTLGATYAAMFPHRVHRMVLDGVVYAPEHYNSLLEHAISSGDSTSKTFDGFISSCIQAGPSRCALAKNVTMDASQLRHHVLNLLTALSNTPLPIPHPNSQAVPSILQPTNLLLSIYAALLRPANWASLAAAIADLEHGDGRAIAALSGAEGRAWDIRNLTDSELAENAGWAGHEMGADEAGMAISCGDTLLFAEPDASWTDSWLAWRDELISNNAMSGAVWFKKLIRCRHWGRICPPPERYEGKSKMGEDLQPPKHPILFVSNTYDPVTPISSGRRMVDVFGSENARLLENNAYGHCSVSQPSLCVGKAIRQYVIDGTLPVEAAVCQPEDGMIFPENIHPDYEASDQSMLQALKDLSHAGLGNGE